MSRKIGWRTEKPSIKELRGVMKFLMKNLMVGTMKVQHGMVVTVINYDHYQTMDNYEFMHEGHNEGTNEVTTNKQGSIKGRNTPPLGSVQKKGDCPYNSILDLYHDILAELPKVRKFTKRRKAMLLARWNEKAKSERGLRSNTLEFWEAFFKYINRSDFLMGRKSDWQANFEWIVTKRNFNKIIEGVYHRG